MKKLPYILLIAVAAALLCAVSADGRAPKRTVKDADAAKADYIFLEALRAKSQGNPDAAFELLSRARELNPSDRNTGMELSGYLLALSRGDSAAVTEALGLMKEYLDENPSDYFTGVQYGWIGEQMLPREDALKVWERLHRAHPDREELTLKYAEMLAKGGSDGDRDRALALFDSLELIEGPGVPLTERKVGIYYNQGDTAAVLAELERLRRGVPPSVDILTFAAQVFTLVNRYDRAGQVLDSAIVLDPTNGFAYYAKAQYLKQIGDSAGSEREVMKAMSLDDLDADTKLGILGSYLQDLQSDIDRNPTDTVRVARLRPLFETLVEQHPAVRDIHKYYSLYLLSAQDYRGAAEEVEVMLGLDPADVNEWQRLTMLYLQVDDIDRAADAAVRGLRYYPQDTRMLAMLGSIRNQQKELEEATGLFEKALSSADSTDIDLLASIYNSLADNLAARELVDSALAMYDKSLLYNPDNPMALNNAAYFMACRSINLDRALDMIQRAVDAEPLNATWMDTYAWVLFKRKDYAKAREAIDKTLELEKEPAEDILEHAGDIHFMDGDPAGALEYWRKALKINPKNELLQRKVKHKTYFYE